MPVCQGCGGSYDDKFGFCPYCGRAKPESKSLKIQVVVSSEDEWETCRIRHRGWWNKYHPIDSLNKTVQSDEFWAEGIGPHGKYLVGESPVYLHDTKGDVNIAHTFLINQLARDGWEAVNMPSHEDWWSITFRRRVRESNPKPWRLWFVYTALNGKKLYFTLAHSPEDATEHLRGKKYINYIFHGKSAEVSVPFLSTNGAKRKEYRDALDEFLREMVKEDFEPVEPSASENLKKMEMPFGNLLGINPWWHYQVLVKRV